MIKAGVYRSPSYNQRTFCFEIMPPDEIKTWFEEPNDNPQDHWWDEVITPQKFHWLVDEWNNGHIKKAYPHWWEKIDTRRGNINSLLQLNHEELSEVFNYHSFVLPQTKWTQNINFDPDYRPLYINGKIVKYGKISKKGAVQWNRREKEKKKYRADQKLWGLSDVEVIADALEMSVDEYIKELGYDQV